MLVKARRRLLLLLVSVSVIALGAHQLFRFPTITNFTIDFTPSGFSKHDTNTREQLHFSNYKFSLTDDFEREVGGWDAFAAKSHDEKCFSFFKLIDDKLPKWQVEFFNNRHFDKSIVKKGDIFKSELERIKKNKAKRDPPEKINEEDKKSANEVYLKILAKTMALEQDMADSMTIIRLFGHCFFNGRTTPVEGELKSIFDRYSTKIIPFFSPEVPLSSAADIESNTKWPFDAKGQVENGNLLDYYYKTMEGSGIVLSTATRHSKDIVKLIHVLRALGNTLPIEVFYRSDLSMRAKQAILLAGSSSKEAILGDEMTDQRMLKRALERAEISIADVYGMPFPRQNITLVNMKRPLSKVGKTEFSSYNNKILALFFSSFEKVLLFDTDTVPLLSIESLRALNEFTDTGAYFFRDRTLLDKNDWIETNYFAKMMPHESYQIDMAFGVKPVTNHTLGNSFMKGWRHCQEAGLIMLDRKRHFRSLLTLLPLTLWGEPIKSSIWGDKEMYWLAMSMAGDEEYTFNQYGAASVGEVTPDMQLKHYNNSKASELCSSHPGHVSADGQLLWINSGFSYCKKNGYARDKSRFPFSTFEDKEGMKTLYENPLRIRHAISPPELPTLRAPSGSPDISTEVGFMFDFKKRKKDVDQITEVNQIDSYDPQKGWVKSKTCSDYQYCAYNAMESFDGSGKLDDSGRVFEFDPHSIKRYDLLGAIWHSSLRVSDLTRPPKSLSVEAEDMRSLNETGTGTSDFKAGNDTEVGSIVSTSPVSLSVLKVAESENTQASSQAENTNQEELRVLDHSGKPIDTGSANVEKENTSEVKSDTAVHFDPTRVRERPEKLFEDVKAAINKLVSTNK